MKSPKSVLIAALLVPLQGAGFTIPYECCKAQVRSQSDSTSRSEDHILRDINRRFLEAWLVRGGIPSAMESFSPRVHLFDSDLQDIAKLAGHDYPQWDASDATKVHAVLALFLADLKNLCVPGKRLDEILWTGLFHSKDTPARDNAVNNFAIDAFFLARASDERLREFSEDVPELKNRNPDEPLYESFFFVKFKRKGEGVCFFALWQKQNSNWLIVDFGALTD
jgi:hypothetical protein